MALERGSHDDATLESTVDSDVARIENAEEVAIMLDGLAEREATIVRKYHLDGLSYAQISAEMGLPENSIGPTLSRARGQLKRSQLNASV
jgi:RNA polymerase sigma-70 factor (ECF subfamily)